MASGSTESESNRVAGDLAGAKNRAQVIGDHIAQWRVARGMTMASLGRAVGVSYQTIQKIEVGNLSMTAESGPLFFAQKGPRPGGVRGTPVSARSGEAGRGCTA